ncbi:hypothetical protein N0V90_004192 [Kalmusia sp. IMI 367209]|nr:hypothetical protein N0V90_004192 [Kalmusia sp. IMI 367209]
MADFLADKEAGILHQTVQVVHVHEQDVGDDIVVDANAGGVDSNLKLAPDGHTVLVPQPSDDPNDPLNWSSTKKHALLIVLSITAGLGDYSSAAGIPLIMSQGLEWNKTPAKVNETGNLNVLMVAIGGLFWIVVSTWWGRGPALFWSTLTGCAFTIACAVTHNYSVYYGFRVLMGFSFCAFQIVGLACIKDMFYFHEHARKIGIWTYGVFLTPYLAPMFSNFIIAGTRGRWRVAFWLVFAVGALDLILIILISDETFYDRTIPQEKQPARPKTFLGRMSRLVGVWQIQNHNQAGFHRLSHSVTRLIKTFLKPIMIPCMIYYAMTFMWVVGINITSAILLQTPQAYGGYGFDNNAIGYLLFAPLIAVTIGELSGHFFNDLIAKRYVKKHNGVFKPEARLLMNQVVVILMVPGLVLVGQTLEKHLSYAGIIMGWGMYVIGSMLASVSLTAYCLDSYGSASSEVAGLLNFARVGAGFSVGYFQEPWGKVHGYGQSFGIQAAIVAAASIIITVLQFYGARMRAKGGHVI